MIERCPDHVVAEVNVEDPRGGIVEDLPDLPGCVIVHVSVFVSVCERVIDWEALVSVSASVGELSPNSVRL